MDAEAELISATIENPEAFSSLRKPMSELSTQVQDQAANVPAGILRVREYAWFQYKNRILDEATLRSYMAPLVRRLQFGDAIMTPWQEFSQEMDPDFRAYINAMLEEQQ
jgi:hypothetical protein